MKLIEKIAKIQQEVSITKDGKNPFYKSKYITLDEIVGKLNLLLVENKLVVIHKNIEDGVMTEIHDIDNEEIEYSHFIIHGITDPQKMGAVITYGRRYNLVSLFNIIADEDDDGNSFYDKKKEVSAIDRQKFTMTNLRKLDATLQTGDWKPKDWNELIDKIKLTHYIPEDMMGDLEMYKEKWGLA